MSTFDYIDELYTYPIYELAKALNITKKNMIYLSHLPKCLLLQRKLLDGQIEDYHTIRWIFYQRLCTHYKTTNIVSVLDKEYKTLLENIKYNENMNRLVNIKYLDNAKKIKLYYNLISDGLNHYVV